MLAIAALVVLAPARAGQDLAQPPANAQTLSIVSGGVRHGALARWTTPDGVRWSRENVSVRSYTGDVDQELTFAPDGTLTKLVARGGTTFGDSAETFAVADGRYTYRSAGDHGDGAYPTG